MRCAYRNTAEGQQQARGRRRRPQKVEALGGGRGARARPHSRSQTNSSSWRRPNRQAKRRSSGQAHSTRRRQIPKVCARRCQGCAPRFHSLFGFRPASDAFRPLQPAGAPSSSWGAALRPMAVPTSRVRGRPAQRRCKKKPKGWMCHDLPRRRDHVLFRAHG